MKVFNKKTEATVVGENAPKKDPVVLRILKRIGKFLKRHIKLVIFLVIVLAIVLYVRHSMKKAAEYMEEMANQPVTAQVEQMDLQQSVKVTGTLTANETVAVTSTLGGTGVTGVKVSKINYKVGDYVNAGDIVVEFDGDDYDRKIAELNAQYSISDAESALSIEDLQKKITDTEKQISDTQEKIDDIQKELDEKVDVYNNVKQLAEDYDKYPESYRNRYETENGAMVTKYGMPIAQFITDYESKKDSIDDLQYQIESYQYSINYLNQQIALAEQKQDYATNYTQVDAYDDIYESRDKTKVEAPISGYILNINVEEGNNYTQGNTVFTIADTSGFIVEATVNEYDIAKVQAGLPAAVKFEATGDEEFSGTVDFVAVASEATVSSQNQSAAYGAQTGTSAGGSTATYKIKINLDDVDDRLRVGMTAKASVILDSVDNVLAVPYDCVQYDENGNSFVTVIADDGTKTDATVTTGLESDYYIEVKGEGIKKGMTVEAIVSDAPSTDAMDYVYYD